MGQHVTNGTRHPQSLSLLAEAKSVYGSLNRVAKTFGVPWSTVANISIDRHAMPGALAAVIAQALGRDVLQAVAAVEMESARPWQVKAWQKVLTTSPKPDGGASAPGRKDTLDAPIPRWRRGRKFARAVTGMRGGAAARSTTWGRICWMLRTRYQIKSATG